MIIKANLIILPVPKGTVNNKFSITMRDLFELLSLYSCLLQGYYTPITITMYNSCSSISDFIDVLLNSIFNHIKIILEPVSVNYSNEVLANQIYDLSILLFILSLIIVFLIIVLLLNIILYINMDKIIEMFNNKFIKWYLILNKKFLSIELFILGITILYFMYSLITGIQFIATHPIIIN